MKNVPNSGSRSSRGNEAQTSRGSEPPHVGCYSFERTSHAIHSVKSLAVAGPYTLKLQFGDDTVQVINFEPVLRGQLYSPLRNIILFNQVRIDPEVHTIVWPNGADFDPATLHDWPGYAPKLIELAKTWELCPA